MAKKAESRLQLRIRKALEKAFPKSKWIKLHGGPFQAAGLADLFGCVQGRLYCFEIKVPGKGKPSLLQLETLREYRKAGAIACIIESVAEALSVVKASQAAPNKWRKEKHIRKRLRPLVRTKDWENLDNWRKPVARRRPRRAA